MKCVKMNEEKLVYISHNFSHLFIFHIMCVIRHRMIEPRGGENENPVFSWFFDCFEMVLNFGKKFGRNNEAEKVRS